MLKMFSLRVIKNFTNISFKKANFTSSLKLRTDLFGRDIVHPQNLTETDWKKILWVAVDLKKRVMSNNTCLNILCNNHITLICLKQSIRNLLSCRRASHLLGGHLTVYLDPEFESQTNYEDCGRAMSQLTDLIIVNGCHQSVLPKLADGSGAPVICLSSNMFSILQSLAFLMTIQEKFGQLNHIKLAWIGPSSPLCNTILSVFPIFGVNLKIFCICAHGTGQMTPVAFESALLACHQGSAEIHQCSTAGEAVYRSHVVITACHPDQKNKVTSEMIEEAELEWIFLHPLPRTEIEVSDSVFRHKNNMTWQATANYLYVTMALIAVTLTHYRPVSKMPQFKVL